MNHENIMSVALVWFRQDLRCHDNLALTTACAENDYVIPLYILDLERNPLGSAQKWWLHHSLLALKTALDQYGLTLNLHKGDALQYLKTLIKQFNVSHVYWNRCYEPTAIQRDKIIKESLKALGITVISCPGNFLNEPWTIKNKTGDYYKVFTPYWKQCLQQISIPNPIKPPIRRTTPHVTHESLDSWSLLPTKPNWAKNFANHWQPGEIGAQIKLEHFIKHHLKNYKTRRDQPALNATSYLSPHLHFGEITPWQIWRIIEQAKTNPNYDLPSIEHFLSELGWREFSTYLLYHFPSLPEQNFKNEFDAFPWQIDHLALTRWQQGQTGFPIVDAGMRELWQTGYMHNRVRMIVASFLIKDLFIDWRIGAAWFWDTLLDADLANNAASWQWVAGSGADAAPYFRIFNPQLQGEKFDPNGEYIKRWIPELSKVPRQWIHNPWGAPPLIRCQYNDIDYPLPMVDHQAAREKALALYKRLKS